MRIPSSLEWRRDVPGGADWLASLPSLIEICAERWSLRIGAPFEDGNVSFVVPVERDGMPAVLKINFPEEETEGEPHALRHWASRGAVRLLECDQRRCALLIERCWPGTQFWEVEDDQEATGIAATVLAMLWRQPPESHRVRLLADAAEQWVVELPHDWDTLGRPFDREILDEAVAACLELGADQGEPVVL